LVSTYLDRGDRPSLGDGGIGSCWEKTRKGSKGTIVIRHSEVPRTRQRKTRALKRSPLNSETTTRGERSDAAEGRDTGPV